MTDNNFILTCRECGDTKLTPHGQPDDVGTQFYRCSRGHVSAPVKKADDGMVSFALKFAESVSQMRRRHLAVWQAPGLLNYIFADLDRRVKHDRVTKISVLLCALSTYLPEPLNLFLRGPSSSGKSYNATETLEYFPEEDVWFLGGMSPKALVHQHARLLDKNGREIDFMENPEKPRRSDYASEEDYRDAMQDYKTHKRFNRERLKDSYSYINISNKIFVFLEAPDPETMRMLYPVLSHDKKRLEYRFVDKSQNGLRTVKVVIEGWPSTIFLTTDRKYAEELATRSFTVSPEETFEKIEAANQLTNLKASLPWECRLETEEYTAIKALIENIKETLMKEKTDVIIPFMDVYTQFPKDMPRDMRDFAHFTQFLKAYTILHLHQRPCLEKEGKKYVLATARDVVDSYLLFRELFESTRTGTEQRVLNFYYAYMMGKEQCYVSDLTMEYNQGRKGKTISDFTIRQWLERLNEIGYVEKREDPNDKRRNIYVPLVKQKQELRENTLNSGNHVNLTAVLKNGFETWKKNICKTPASYTKNFFDNTSVTLEELEMLILDGVENVPALEEGEVEKISVQQAGVFKYPFKLENGLEQEKKLENTCNPENKAISNNLEDFATHVKSLQRLTLLSHGKCELCGAAERLEWQASRFNGSWSLLCGECGLKTAKQLQNIETK